MPRGTQVKRDGLAITVENRGTSSEIALRHPSRTQLHVWSAKDHNGGETAPQRSQGSDSQDNQDWRCQGAPTQTHILIAPEEPQVLLTAGGGGNPSISLDTGATFSVLTEAPGPLSSWSASIVGLSGRAKRYYFSCSLSCNWSSVLFSHEFPIVPVSFTPLGEGYAEQGPWFCFQEYEALPFSPFNWKKKKSKS